MNTTAKVLPAGRSDDDRAGRSRAIDAGSSMPSMQPLPPGEDGRTLYRRARACRGYLKQTELTEQPFRALGSRRRPALPHRRPRRASAAGEVEFFGRIDDQVKIRGYQGRTVGNRLGAARTRQRRIGRCHSARSSTSVSGLAAYVVADDLPKKALDRVASSCRVEGEIAGLHGPELSRRARRTADADDRQGRPQAAAGAGATAGRRSDTLPPPVNADRGKNRRNHGRTFSTSQAVGTTGFLPRPRRAFLDRRADGGTRLRSRADLRIAVRDVYAYPDCPQVGRLSGAAPAAARRRGATAPARSGRLLAPRGRPRRRRAAGAALRASPGTCSSTPLFVVLPIADDLLRGERRSPSSRCRHSRAPSISGSGRS